MSKQNSLCFDNISNFPELLFPESEDFKKSKHVGLVINKIININN